jgi:hypothetical protein
VIAPRAKSHPTADRTPRAIAPLRVIDLTRDRTPGARGQRRGGTTLTEHPLAAAFGWLCILTWAVAVALLGDALSAGPPPYP